MKITNTKNIYLSLLLLSGLASGAVFAASNMLAAKNGMTIYTFDKDKANSGKSACSNDCATSWPPVPASEASSSAADFGNIARADGFKQLTYRGSPVYFFAGDTKAGEANGEGMGGVWHVIKDAPKSAQTKDSGY